MIKNLMLGALVALGLTSCGETEDPTRGVLEFVVNVFPELDDTKYYLGNEDYFVLEMTDGAKFESDAVLIDAGENLMYHVRTADAVDKCYTFTIDAIYQGKVINTSTLEMSGFNYWEDFGCKNGFEATVNIIIP